MLKKMRGLLAVLVVVLMMKGWYVGCDYVNEKTFHKTEEIAHELGLGFGTYNISGSVMWSLDGELRHYSILMPYDELGPKCVDVVYWWDNFR